MRAPSAGPSGLLRGALGRLAWGLLIAVMPAQGQDQRPTQAQTANPGTSGHNRLAPVEVIELAPLPGHALAADEVPSSVQSRNAAEIDASGAAHVGELLDRSFGSVHVNEAQGSPWQTDVSYRGFVASPLLGNPIGLSVFVDSVRINESFGDTVLWDLIPANALESATLVPGVNPVFGLNTLGGALALRTKSGRSAPGLQARALAGAFGRRQLSISHGVAQGAWDRFLALNLINEDGWREHSPSQLRQFFGKLGWHDADSTLSLSLTHVENRLTGNGMVPVDWLAGNGRTLYTHPDITEPTLDFLRISGERFIGDHWTLAGNAYWRALRLDTFNGDAEFDNGDTPGDTADDAYEAENRRTATRQTSRGLAAQLAYDGLLGGQRHRIAWGATLDEGRARFAQDEQAAEFDASRGTVAAGPFVTDTLIEGRNRYQGLYVSDSISLGPRWTLSLSARHTRARVRIRDLSGTEPALNGEHVFSRTSPAIGASLRIGPTLTLFGGYHEGIRIPTAVELSCADPAAPCALPVAFVADPPLNPVIAHAIEIGMRGHAGPGMRWRTTLFRTDLTDDILFTSTGASQGFFANVPRTRREGIEFAFDGRHRRIDWSLQYTNLRASYRSNVALFNPLANAADPSQAGTTPVSAGNRLPGIPSQILKASIDYRASAALSLGATIAGVDRTVLRGDEANARRQLGGHLLLNLRAGWQLSPAWRLVARIDNVFDQRYATLGALNRNGFDADGVAREGSGPGPISRFVSPGAPRALWLGVALNLAP